MSRSRALVSCAALLVALPASAERDHFFVGNGHLGALVVSVPSQQINVYAVYRGNPDPLTVQLDDASGFVAGDLVMLLVMKGPGGTAGDQSAVGLTTSPLGRYELARVTSVSFARSQLSLEVPLASTFPVGATQVISVPEYSGVSFIAGTKIVAQRWNGQTGGVIALLVDGVVDMTSLLAPDIGFSASGAGYAGAATVADPDGGFGCAAMVTAPSPSAGRRGEAGFDESPPGAGRGNFTNGGGGGLCRRGGGGGGALLGQGGNGGNSPADFGYGGLGGASLVLPPVPYPERLLLGGGGGAPHSTDGQPGGGASGGGIVFLRARTLSGGRFAANGASGSAIMTQGGGGGGAGGTIVLRIAGLAGCIRVDASGGYGGTAATMYMGPGGGGSGGYVFVQATSVASCLVPGSVYGGPGGTFPGGTVGDGQTGQAGVLGSTTSGTAYAPVAAPTLATPADGDVLDGGPVTISGRADAPVTRVEVVVDLQSPFDLAVNVDAGFGGQLGSLAPGPHTLHVWSRVDDVYSNEVTRQITLLGEVDAGSDGGQVPEPFVSITSPHEGDTVHDLSPAFQGLATAGAFVKVSVDGAVVATAVAAPSGEWIAQVPSQTPLASGLHLAQAGVPGATSNAVHFTALASPSKVGCGCSATAGPLLLLLAALALRRRRR